MKSIQAFEVEKAQIHDVERAGLGQQLIEDVDLVHLAAADVDEGWDVAAQIEQRVQFDRRLGRAKGCPRKHRQAQIDSGRIQRVDRLLQIDAEGFVDIQPSCDPDQALGEVGVDAPVANSIGVGERVARYRRANPKVIELGLLRTQARFDVAQTLPISQLCEGHAQKLVQAGEPLDLVLALIPGHAATKRGQRQMLHQLREHQLAMIHRSSPRSRTSQGHRTRARSSNRDQTISSL